jgi:UDP-N-acetylglucosamine 4,6-dehydratase/5-epimerase
MITESDGSNTVDLGKYYAILPVGAGEYTLQSYCQTMRATPVDAGIRYDSSSNPDFLSVVQLQTLISDQAQN